MLWVTAWGVRTDTLLDNLTVEEMLMYTAELKCPMSESLASKREKVGSIIDQLALGGCRGVRIGNTLARGISGAYLIKQLLNQCLLDTVTVSDDMTNALQSAS